MTEYTASKLKLKELARLPESPSGCIDVRSKYQDRVIDVEFDIEVEGSLITHYIQFDFVIFAKFDHSNNGSVDFPGDSGMLYGFEPRLREGFKGYMVWLADDDVITIVCKQVICGNEVY